ncbi:MAG: glycosyltransferase, partial [Treponema sp.]|nr:glycosyltransferase [Treponema sp.]
MKVLILNYTDAGGGAAIAAFRLAKSLNEHGVKTTLGVVEKQTASNFVIALPHTQNLKLVRYKTFAKNALKKILRKFFPHIAKIFLFNSTNTILHSTNKKSLVDVNWINNSDFDLVNLHWINNDMLSIKDISKIKKPLLWTMHDSWPCSGAEHHQNVLENDTRWKEGYYSSNKPLTTTGPDICKKVWNQKKKYLQNKKISFVCPSNWEKDVLMSSALFKNQTCYVVPNIIPSSIFFKKDKKNIRSLLDIPQNKKIIGFGAAENISDLRNRKGSYHLLEALTKLKNNEKYFLVIFGNASDAFTSKVPLPFFASGYVSNPKILS